MKYPPPPGFHQYPQTGPSPMTDDHCHPIASVISLSINQSIDWLDWIPFVLPPCESGSTNELWSGSYIRRTKKILRTPHFVFPLILNLWWKYSSVKVPKGLQRLVLDKDKGKKSSVQCRGREVLPCRQANDLGLKIKERGRLYYSRRSRRIALLSGQNQAWHG